MIYIGVEASCCDMLVATREGAKIGVNASEYLIIAPSAFF